MSPLCNDIQRQLLPMQSPSYLGVEGRCSCWGRERRGEEWLFHTYEEVTKSLSNLTHQEKLGSQPRATLICPQQRTVIPNTKITHKSKKREKKNTLMENFAKNMPKQIKGGKKTNWKRCSLAIKRMEIKTIFQLADEQRLFKANYSQCWLGYRGKGTPTLHWWESNWRKIR